jgi:hypothetical protein
MAALAVAITLLGVGMLGFAGGFAMVAVRRTRAYEAASPPGGPLVAGSGVDARDGEDRVIAGAADGGTQGGEDLTVPYGPRASVFWPWAGAAIGAGLGFMTLVVAAAMLVTVLDAPSHLLRTPTMAGGLRRDDSTETRLLIERQRDRLRQSGLANPVTAIYRGASTTVLFVGSSGLDAPLDRLREYLAGIALATGPVGREPEHRPAGRLGGTVLCLSGPDIGLIALTTCGWADGGTLGIITTDGRDTPGTANLLLAMRADMEKPA